MRDSDEPQRLPPVPRTGPRDNPEQYPTENTSLFDMWESEKHVDPIPVEDLKLERKDEKHKSRSKNESSSENKYKEGSP